MDENEAQRLQIVQKLNKSQFLKRTPQFLVSVSLFSLVVCYYYAGFSFYPLLPFNLYYSTFLFSFFTHAIDRMYMFLICNGILVFLAKSSVSTSASPLSSDKSLAPADQMKTLVDDDQEVTIGSVDNSVAIIGEDQELGQEHEEVAEPEPEPEQGEAEPEEGGDVSVCTDKEEKESGAPVAAEEDKEKDENGSLVKQEMEEVEVPMVPNEELLSTDELNKKFEEFIRKMKEEIRIEAQQQRIAV